MNGYPVGDDIMSSTLEPTQKVNVMIIIQARSPLTAVVKIMDLGIVLLADCSSSDCEDLLVTLISFPLARTWASNSSDILSWSLRMDLKS